MIESPDVLDGTASVDPQVPFKRPLYQISCHVVKRQKGDHLNSDIHRTERTPSGLKCDLKIERFERHSAETGPLRLIQMVIKERSKNGP